jgi:hypothetical protein
MWQAIYRDGTRVPEFDDEETNGRGFVEVDSLQVKTLELLPTMSNPEDRYRRPMHRVSIPDGATPVFFRRRTVTINNSDDFVIKKPTKHCIGWKKDEQACYLFVFDDGSTLLTTDKQAV